MSDYGIMRVPRRRPPARRSGSGWVVFAGVMLLVASVLNAIYGFSAIYNDDYVAEEEFLYGPVSLWGWLAVGIAVVMLITALGVFVRNAMATYLGIFIAAVNALVHLTAIGGATALSILVIAVDALIVYGLAAHGSEP
jgi:ABC-type multidrug transport system permease subunit